MKREKGILDNGLATWFGLVAVVGLAGCGQELTVEQRCQEVIAAFAVCYPDLATEASCTQETLQRFEAAGLSGKDCDDIREIGKADWFAIGGCGAGEHVCGHIFCCDDYTVSWFPAGEADWDILDVVDRFQAAIPADVLLDAERASRDELLDGVSWSYEQEVAEYLDAEPRNMAVEITLGLAEVPYEEFVRILPANLWGIHLDHHLGGEVIEYERDARDRVVRQLERMVLSPFPCDYESPLSNNDMTKVEVIVYGEEGSKVYWRVMFSDNNSTETDVGSVEFLRWDESTTLIRFHSAHRLNAPGGIHIPSGILKPALSNTFLDFVRHYIELVERQS